MACRSVVQTALSFTSSLPSKASRKTIISPRSFQVLARESRRPLSSSISLLLSQFARASPRQAPCRALHGSTRAWAPETQEPDQSHGLQISKVATDKKREREQEKTADSTLVPRLTMEIAPSVLSELVRTKMRGVPQPVTIVTSSNTQTHPDGSARGWHGATISSFNTVTLTPIPIISFNIKNNSSTFAAIEASGRLWVHFLTVAPSATSLAKQFAERRHGYPRFLTRGRTEKQHESDAVQLQPTKVPLVPSGMGKDGRIAFILECHYMKDKTVRIGDHVVLFASVAEVINTTSSYVFEGTGFQPRGPCLVYADGEYQGVTPLKKSRKDHNSPDASQRKE